MIGYAREHVPQIAFWIEPIQFSRSDQAIQDGRALSPGIGTGEQIILTTQSDGAQGTFGSVVVDLQAPVVAVPSQRRPQRERITDRRRRVRLARKLASEASNQSCGDCSKGRRTTKFGCGGRTPVAVSPKTTVRALRVAVATR